MSDDPGPLTATAETMDLRPGGEQNKLVENRACRACGADNQLDARFCAKCGTGFDAHNDVADPLVGRIVADRYRIKGLLGRGGMGVVYRVEHIHIGKSMAMKLLHGALANDRSTVRRFEREADAASRLSHPNTVQVFDFGRSEGMLYMVMELLDGHDLGALVRMEGPLPFERAARLLAQVCASVAEAHDAGIVHRDLKPENIMVLSGVGGLELAKVLDFGLAKVRDLGAAEMSLTQAGAIMGTPYYMAPEQIRGKDVGPAGDVYALGASLYKVCTGVPPFTAQTPIAVLSMHLNEPLTLPSARVREEKIELPPAADAIIAKAMEKDPERRYRSARELRDDLLAYLASIGGESQAGESAVVQALAAIESTTKKEVERFERGLRRRGQLAWVFVLLLLVGAAFGGYRFYRQIADEEVVATEEVEPNEQPAEANPLPRAVGVSGLIGQRQERTLSDADMYVLQPSLAEPGTLSLSVSAIPNLDLVLDLFRRGHTDPVLSANAAPRGQGERILNYPLRAGETYLVRVHERWITNQQATENVSDRYEIQWDLAELPTQVGEDALARFEREVNNTPELAEELPPGNQLVGAYIGWGGDVDHFCVGPTDTPATFTVSGVEQLDLRLTWVEDLSQREHVVDEAGLGAGEFVTLPPATGRRCVQVDVDVDDSAVQMSDTPYTIQVDVSEAEHGD